MFVCESVEQNLCSEMCSKEILLRELGIGASSDSSDSETETVKKIELNANLGMETNCNEVVNATTITKEHSVTKKNYNIWSNIIFERQLAESLSKNVNLDDKRMNGNGNGNSCFKNWRNKKFKRNCKRDYEDKERKTLTVKVFEPKKDKQASSNVNQNNKKKRFTNVDPIVEPVVHTITTQLKEPKVHLIRKIVDVIGCQEAMRFCTETLDIESAGGLMTSDGNRRRTPGGVFLTLLKSSKKISSEQKEHIFIAERQMQQKKKKVKRKFKRSKTHSQQLSLQS